MPALEGAETQKAYGSRHRMWGVLEAGEVKTPAEHCQGAIEQGTESPNSQIWPCDDLVTRPGVDLTRLQHLSCDSALGKKIIENLTFVKYNEHENHPNIPCYVCRSQIGHFLFFLVPCIFVSEGGSRVTRRYLLSQVGSSAQVWMLCSPMVLSVSARVFGFYCVGGINSIQHKI